jgi:pimeloyl-ACP methyl ester carboxylesterase
VKLDARPPFGNLGKNCRLCLSKDLNTGRFRRLSNFNQSEASKFSDGNLGGVSSHFIIGLDVPPSIRRLILWATLALLASFGCMGSGRQLAACSPDKAGNQDVVYVADGAGDFRAASLSVDHVVHGEKIPVCVEPIVWSHGYGRVFADQLDREFARKQGRRLAEELIKRKQAEPQCRIYLLAHSAGSLVVLSAAGAMPADSIERVVLLAPSVRADYDLRCALRATRRTIDVYYSPDHDFYVRGAAVLSAFVHFELSRRAGQIGFEPVVESEADAQLYEKLRLIPWDPAFGNAGNSGGHYGGYQPEFLKDYVLPLMLK